MAIVIKRRVGLDFLGDDYKDAYLTFQSIPVIDYEAIQTKLKQFETKTEGSVGFILATLKKYFIEGQFPGLDTVVAADLDGLDPQACTECFKAFTGQELDPKAETPLTDISPTAAAPPLNS